MKENLLERIETNPQIMMGNLVIKGTRFTVEIILEKLAYSYTEEDTLKEYPLITRDNIKATILYDAKVLSFEKEYIVSK